MTINVGISPKIDESIQSFIFRIIIRTGWEDFSTVITHGGWGKIPSVPYDIRCDINSHDWCFLFEKFESQLYVGKDFSLFRNRFSHATLFRETFFPNKKKSSCGSSVPLRFCRFCIENQLVEQGFSYFKLDWLNKKFCNVHSVPLHKIRDCLSISETRDTLKSIIFAEWDKISDFISMELSHSTVVSKKPRFDDAKAMLAISFANCAKRDLIRYFTNQKDCCPNGLFSVADYGLLSEQDRYLIFVKRKVAFLKKQLEDAYDYGLENSYSSLMGYCNRFIEYKRVIFFGVEHYIMKSKERQCLACLMDNCIYFRSCSAVGVISYPTGVDPKQENICDKFLDDIERRVELYQKQLKVDYGERFVRRSIERSKEIRASGGLELYRIKRKSRLKLAAKALDDLT
ncbi:hypothetical protein [Aeromonas salmonicida]|uniref:hypothetical protein n=1 Tax=Aeromonas salmonicida TaxID=645 RepID=UPI00370D08C0